MAKKKKKKKNNIKANIIQVVLIVFSVVLGLYLNERIEERKNRHESDNLLALIKSEVNDNVKLMGELTSYHQKMHEDLDSLCKSEIFVEEFVNDKSILFNRLFTRGTFLHRFPANDAWDIAKSHPLIANIDYDKLLILSKIYNQQNATFEPMHEMFEIHSSKDLNIKTEAKSNLEIIASKIKELVARELLLMHYYEEAEEILDLQN